MPQRYGLALHGCCASQDTGWSLDARRAAWSNQARKQQWRCPCSPAKLMLDTNLPPNTFPPAYRRSLVSSQRPGASWQSAAGQVRDPLHRGGDRPMPSHRGPHSPRTPEPGVQDGSTMAVLMVHSACPELSCLAHTQPWLCEREHKPQHGHPANGQQRLSTVGVFKHDSVTSGDVGRQSPDLHLAAGSARITS